MEVMEKKKLEEAKKSFTPRKPDDPQHDYKYAYGIAAVTMALTIGGFLAKRYCKCMR